MNYQNSFEKTQSDPFVFQNGTAINSLLYADDLIILSQSKSGLQNCLDQLNEWCRKWLMEVNTKKTKIMIFQKQFQITKSKFVHRRQ